MFASDRIPVLEQYVELLATEGIDRGLMGPREAPRLWDRHVLNSGVVAELLPQGCSLADLGSGAGLPGLVLALARPDLDVVLVEPLARRTSFLEHVVRELSVPNVEVHRGKAESLHGVRRFDRVTSRALAPLARLLDWSMPLVAPGGAMTALKGTSVAEEVEECRDLLARGGAVATVRQAGEGLLPRPTTVLEVVWADAAQVRWPGSGQDHTVVGRGSGGRGRRRGPAS